MATYIIADLKLFDNEQRDKLGFNSFAAMNSYVIKSWNSVVKPEDSIIVMGNMGNGNFDEMREVIDKLNGEITITSKHINEKFSKTEWLAMGIKHFWGVSMFNTLPDGREILYVIKPVLVPSVYEADYALLVTDSENPFDGFIKGIMLSADAAKWSYSPLNTDELLTIYENMKMFEEMDDGTEKRSDIKEEGEE